MIRPYLEIFCDRCTNKQEFACLAAAEKAGWEISEKTGVCLCPLCVWEKSVKAIAGRSFQGEAKAEIPPSPADKESLKENKKVLKAIRASRLLKDGEVTYNGKEFRKKVHEFMEHFSSKKAPKEAEAADAEPAEREKEDN